LRTYAWLARLRRPRGYRAKILLVAFAGTHVPLVALLAFALSRTALPAGARLQVLGVALVATLAGTAATLLLLNGLLAPVAATARALRGYLRDRTLPELPTGFRDEMGVLMADAVQMVRTLDTSLRFLSTHDPLTRLVNQARFRERLGEAFAEAHRTGSPLAVLLLDVDGFSAFNNLRGRAAGDRVLREIGARLGAVAHNPDDAARVGGDEFAVLCTGAGAADVAEAAGRIVESLAAPLDGAEMPVSVSLGIALFPSDASDAEALLAGAEEALVRARMAGGGVYRFATATDNEALRRRGVVESALAGALERGELALHFQPQVDGASGAVVGAEALMRWHNPELGWVSPAEFIPIAEANGAVSALGDWALDRACAQAAEWRAAGLPPLRMAVNLSARQLEEPGLVDRMRGALQRHALPADALELEVTESFTLRDVDGATRTLAELRAAGFAVSLDDFGTGHSSLARLVSLPITGLKIDRMFVRELGTGRGGEPVVGALLALGRQLGLEVTAEGVETEAQAAALRAAGCDRLQGFHLGRPTPAAELTALLRAGGVERMLVAV
jgi:diguanylate cyclase (GGDEF)-like protein